MKIIPEKVGAIHTNCFIIYDENTKDAVIVDPGAKATYLIEKFKEYNLKLRYILLTHGHFDHILAVNEIQEATGAKLVIHKKDGYKLDTDDVNREYERFTKGEYKSGKVSFYAEDGDEFAFGGLTAKYIHTPGHTKGSCVIQIENSWFTGDTLFAGECGRCDLEGGNFDKMLQSLKKLAEIEGNFDIYPGHEGFSTLNEERKTNRYIKHALSI